MIDFPSLSEMRSRHELLSDHVVRTPVCRWQGLELDELLPDGAEVFAKLEFLQETGTFKARGALSNILVLPEAKRKAGVTGASAGNHAIAMAFAAKAVGTSAKVVMQASANPARISAARAYGADVALAPDGPAAFAAAETIAMQEGRAIIPPFEGVDTVLGTAGVGLELMDDIPDLEAVIVAVGGGGLAAGVSAAVKALNPECSVIGVEPDGADCMRRSFEAGQVLIMDRIETIADSLAPPMTLPISFEVCRQNLDEIVTVSDEELRRAMVLIFRSRKLAVEPACAATTAAIVGPLREHLRDKRVGIILCGSNIDLQTFVALSEMPN